MKTRSAGLRIPFVLLSLFLVVMTHTCLGSPNITVRCSEQERLALLKFKYSVKDDFKMLSSWVGTECCSWKGVRCDGATGSVVGLHLRGNVRPSYSCGGRFGSTLAESVGEDYYLVVEEVNSSLAELIHLKYLDLSGNNFQQSRIPDFIGALKQLSYLNLSNAGFSGNIPHHIGNLSSLKVLDLYSLSYSQELMTDNIAWISGLSSLEHLNLNGVDLSQTQNRDVVFYMIPSLKELSLSCCRISNSDLAGPRLNSSRMLPNIKHLDLSLNAFEGSFPSVLTNMSSLLSLDLSENFLNSSIPIIPSLLKLDLSYNNIGQIQHIGIWRQCHLKQLSVSENYLGDEIIDLSTNESICSHYALELLELSENELYGSIPESIERLTCLRVLHLGSNKLKGPLPGALGRLSFLEVLDISFNQLVGPIPTFLGQLTKLDLSYNHLNDSIPESFGELLALTDLHLERNQLTGPIPTSLGRLASLQTFIVYSNLLNGTLPVQVGQLTKLGFLDVSNNSLEGVVTEAHFANLTMLKYLDLSSNTNLTFNVSREWIPPFLLRTIRLGSCKISDEFPLWLQTQNKVDELVLSNASLSGPLPIWLRHMPVIRVLDLSHNNLSGPLTNLPFSDPLSGFQDKDFGSLYLQDNLFNGLIPRSLCSRTGLDFLDLSRNKLTGKLPYCLANLENLSMMLLSSNRFSGKIPSSIGHNSPFLSWLNLNDNNFFGELPRDLSKLRALRVLDLGDNKISGKIPEWIGEKLTSLMVLRLHNNRFSGRIPQSLCKSSYLQILDIAQNSITGQVPRCFGAFYGMVDASQRDVRNGSYPTSNENVIQVMKGVELKYSNTLGLVFNMDLSSNKLVGPIPEELMTLSLLLGLNLSHNHLIGGIPDNIGNMKALFSLDLSSNGLTGTIPSSMTTLNFLSHLNLSHNNLSGRIPTGNQLQTLTDPAIYDGNRNLCGAPLPRNCSNPTTTTSKKKYDLEAADESDLWLYVGIICGLATGFWGVIGVLLLKKQWRHKLFMFSEINMDRIHVAVVLRISKLKNKRNRINP